MFAKVKPNTQIIGQNLVYFARLNSTNSFAIELFRNNLADNGTVIYTDNQTMGRGQMQKEWISNPFENLMFSIIIKPVTNGAGNSFLLNKCITLAIFHYVSGLLPKKKVKIKWPNDIMVNGKKIAGILVENSFSGHHLNVSIVGIGLNVNQNFTSNKLFNATSLFDNRNEVFDRAQVLEKLLENIDLYYFKLINHETEFISFDFDRNLLGFETENEFIVDGSSFKAVIAGCDPDGRLMLKQGKTLKSYMHGDIKQVIA